MTTLGSWIDDEALTQLFRDLCPDRDSEIEQRPPSHDDQSASLPLESLPPADPSRSAAGNKSTSALLSRLSAVRERAQRSGLIGGKGKEAGSSDSQFIPPQDTFAVRIEALHCWILDQFGAQQVCISDNRGEPLTTSASLPGLSATSALVAEAWHISHRETDFKTSGLLHLPMDQGNTLSVVATSTSEGLFSIAIVGRIPLSRSGAERCRSGFLSAIDVPDNGAH